MSTAHLLTKVRQVCKGVVGQLPLMPFGLWFMPVLIVLGLVWVWFSATGQANAAHSVALYSTLASIPPKLQVVPAVIGVCAVLAHDQARSRDSSALAMPWPTLVLWVRLAVAVLMGWIWAIGVNLLGYVLLVIAFRTNPANSLGAIDAFGAMPLYAGLLALFSAGVAALLNRFVPAMITLTLFFALVVPGIGVIWPSVGRYLPGLAGIPPTLTFNPTTSLSQSQGLMVLAAWALLVTAIAIYQTTRRNGKHHQEGLFLSYNKPMCTTSK